MQQADVAVVGGGIVGLAFAWEAARRGRSVVLFERDARSKMASVRNFGMVWPIGQPPGEQYRRATVSRERWLELRDLADVWAAECGSVHAVYEADEDAVLREFASAAPGLGIMCEYVEPAAAVRRFPALRPEGLRGVLFSPTELCVDPRAAIARIPSFLQEAHGITLRFGTAVTAVAMPTVRTATGEAWRVRRCFVCSGADFETLFPNVYAASGVQRCKLQMMRTVPQPGGWRLGPHLAGGLTLGHYNSFEMCPSLSAVKRRHAAEFPEHARFGVHVMASQNHLGEVVIGDSHEYGGDFSPFDSPAIDALILDYLRRIVRLPEWTIAGRWHGVYVKHPTKSYITAEPQPGCCVVTAPGGAGMTLSFGTAAAWWDANPNA
ncbi:fad dependent oxidoreductase : FAD dependent oxidoreductase OS=Gloeocapsa sp. PCC 7428 GN=Glo7428_4949 PE=4 SV=1: DAO [Gemmataceae bacterium]|nr:fad dependent oxidoreductase : FAD dependent oxidoreductase OS=Gloeocapsa sp. PCC 7428 GN=Glo7428_4949 PE=4 SV=1: DAO [Gemmataceae bacterium]VTU02566.1 fad dependent oxidoreductase : FAD dependent oxidoreductase OS=Gloeocapsa sp. PCC 7428 GN=Glo7428_4949 PE=4 SV=1: DAO [Gemmataceae bacterium]